MTPPKEYYKKRVSTDERWDWADRERNRRADCFDTLVEALREARLQIKYLDEKFASTGTSAAVMAHIDTALGMASNANAKENT